MKLLPCWILVGQKLIEKIDSRDISIFSCHGFHHLLCKIKSYHWCTKDNCECEKCGEKIGLYHLFGVQSQITDSITSCK